MDDARPRRRTTVYLPKELLRRAKQERINVSGWLTNRLDDYFKWLDAGMPQGGPRYGENREES